MKTFEVTWTEVHVTKIEADDESDAMEKWKHRPLTD